MLVNAPVAVEEKVIVSVTGYYSLSFLIHMGLFLILDIFCSARIQATK